MRDKKRISNFDSENLMYAVIQEVLREGAYTNLDVVCHFPLAMLVDHPDILSPQERKFAMHPKAHLDFFIYNTLGKQPVVAIEVDAYRYHRSGSVQAIRDGMKNHMMEICGIPLFRFATNGSGEKERLAAVLAGVRRG